MNTIINIKHLLVTMLLAITMQGVAQDFTPITAELQGANISNFVAHFDSNVELTILDNEGMYSKGQVETILNDFLGKNKPSAYKKVHEGNSGNGAFFQIGELSTTSGTFRTYLYAKNINGKFVVQGFKIEEN